ncbi:hypothetical protein [Bradyrhizobium retamae]|uniref:hypothetical protein n=1 Tax=Bradyrhizobium retamae TaxID=1300035 RepID=UPI000AF8CC0E|nr:hypothetical protein [Bradyrhizobium retamae]
MNEPKKLAVVFLVIMALGLIAIAIEWLRMRVSGWLALIIVSLILLLLALSIHPIRAHDHGRPGLDGWYSGLKSGKGPCCDGPGVDAMHLSDVDWESKDGRYRVRIEGEWVDVPDDAVLKQANRDGHTLVWPTWQDGKRAVRCFIPGIMT